MSRLPPISLIVHPYECDACGHLSEAGFFHLFERARWETLAQGPGTDVFRTRGLWPAVRKLSVEFHHPVSPGDRLEITTHLDRLGRTSMELRQEARRPDGSVAAQAQMLFVMIDGLGNPAPVPEPIAELFGTRVSTRPGEVVRYDVGEVTLAVDVRGDGPALLLVHGFPLDRSIWKHQVATLSGWRRIAPDLRGMGMSDAPRDGYSMEAYAGDLVRLLDRLRVRKAVVAGLSMGGYIAFEMLRRYRDRIAGLILCDTKAEADGDQARRGRDQQVQTALGKGSAAVADHMVPRLLGRTTQQTQPQLATEVREMIAKSPAHGIAGALVAMRDRPDSSELLGGIDVPTLVIVGQEDELVPPAAAKAMTAAIPSAVLTTIAGAGHVPPLEAPIAVSRVFGEFLEAIKA